MKNSLSNIFSIFNSKENAFVGIDIGSSYIKIAQLRKTNGRIVLETYGEVALGPYEDRQPGELTNLSVEKLSQAISNLLVQSNVNAKKAVVSISSATSLIFILKLPKRKSDEMSTMIKNEARKYIPIPLTEVSLDWWIIPKQEVYGDETVSDTVSVLVAAVRNEIVTKYNAVIKEMKKFEAPAFEIETFSSIRGSFKRELAPVLLIDTGSSGTRVAVVEHGVIRKFYVINRGGSYLTSSLAKSLEIDFTEAEQLKRSIGLDSNSENKEAYNILYSGINFVFSEIQNVIFDFEKDYKKPIRKVILTGGGSLLKNYREIIESKFNITTQYADPFDKAVSPEFLEGVLDRAGPEFTVAVGLALQGLE